LYTFELLKMPLNKEVFKTRAISAVVFVVIMLAGLLWNHWSFLVLFSIIHFGCWWEYFNLVEQIHHTSIPLLERIGFMLMGYALMISFCGPAYSLAGYGLMENLFIPLATTGFLLAAYGIISNRQATRAKALFTTLSGLVYISLSWGLMLSLRQRDMQSFMGDMGLIYPILLIVSIWINDTMAYIVGSLMGKTPFSKISPKKTWEGTIGGMLLAIVIVAIAAQWSVGANWRYSAAIAAIAAVMGTLGDLLESWLKRRAGVKDSGQMMPGHGGFLDRFDSMLLATPFVWLIVNLLGM
jgi:phosphatidate cytidylyltransferase